MGQPVDEHRSRSPILRFLGWVVRARSVRLATAAACAFISLALSVEWFRTFDQSDKISYGQFERTGVTSGRSTGWNLTFCGAGIVSAWWSRSDENGMWSRPPPDGGMFSTEFGRPDARAWHSANPSAFPFGHFDVNFGNSISSRPLKNPGVSRG